jgi:hypothetical protein
MFDRQAALPKAVRSVVDCSCRARAGPGRKRIPFGPSHAAFFIADLDEDKRSVVLPGLRSRECGRKPVRISDRCCVCHVTS